MNEEKSTAPYFIKQETTHCEACFRGGTWSILGSDNVPLAEMYDEKSEAQSICDVLNTAFYAGRNSYLSFKPENDVVLCLDSLINDFVKKWQNNEVGDPRMNFTCYTPFKVKEVTYVPGVFVYDARKAAIMRMR